MEGPTPIADMKRHLAAGAILPTDHAWREGAADWLPVSSFAELSDEKEKPRRPILPTIRIRLDQE